MNIRDLLTSESSLPCSTQQVVWEPKTKPKTPKNKPKEKGEKPYQLEIYNSYSSSSSQSTSSNKSTIKEKKTNFHKNKFAHKEHNRNMETIKVYNPNQFAHIIPSVREATGGSNTQSNEAIERRHRERQQQYAEANSEQSNSDSSNATTSSSETSESYRTTLQDSYELRTATSEQVTSETQIKSNLQRYKKNVLMLGLLRHADSTNVESEDTTTESSGDYYDTTSFDDVASGLTNLNINDENVMHSERICRYFQSTEDEDVYYHPLKEQIQKDPEWQKLRLKRKGTETVCSPRQYYTSLRDEEFTFESRKPN